MKGAILALLAAFGTEIPSQGPMMFLGSTSNKSPTELLDVVGTYDIFNLGPFHIDPTSKGLHNSTLLRFCDRLGLLLASLDFRAPDAHTQHTSIAPWCLSQFPPFPIPEQIGQPLLLPGLVPGGHRKTQLTV